MNESVFSQRPFLVFCAQKGTFGSIFFADANKILKVAHEKQVDRQPETYSA
jgi:hypothetical protein